jgi:hypothetical protein
MKFNFSKLSANDQSWEQTELVAVYELANIFDCFYDFGGESNHAFTKTEASDLTAMIRLLCEQEKWNFDNFIGVDTTYKMLTDTQILGKIFIRLGKVIQQNHYNNRYGNYPKGNPQESMRELIHYLRQFCVRHKWDFWELCDLGESRYKERMKDLREHGVNEQLRPEFRRKE